ncbi:hypothetical protein B0H10DRAFT_1953048 [Mycena sp. CBHHK59/15]|nr:hypothetical protein B0H10DRAFT_1953048 [Mycena sp. CBHHK59/15]
MEASAGSHALAAYIDILDQTEKELIAAAKQGGNGRGDGGDRTRSPTLNGSARGCCGQRSRSRSIDPPPDKSTSKRRRVDDSMLPWVVDDFIIEGQLTPELTKSRALLQEFAKDPKYVVSSLLNSTNHISFPESKWSAIIKGQAVNLDKVITSHYSVSHDKQHAETIGNGVQILFGSSETTKSIRTQSDWIAAWTKAAEATVFVFPHRRRELDQYRSYIMDTFISCSENVHEHVILLDRKLCNEVAAR